MMSDRVRESIQVALEQLHDERERIDGAIAKLESFLGDILDSATASMVRGGGDVVGKARGRQRIMAAKQRSRAGWTHEARQAAAERMRDRWAARRKSRSSPADVHGQADDAAAAAVANDSVDAGRKAPAAEVHEVAGERVVKLWQSKQKNNGMSHDGSPAGVGS